MAIAVLVPSSAAAHELAAFDDRAAALAARFWPGPLTLVLARTEASRRWDLCSYARTIGLRVPHHPLALAALAITGPLAVTSANQTGDATPRDCDGLDRKSTRLNSSHVKISYAVFCLKKKKNT